MEKRKNKNMKENVIRYFSYHGINEGVQLRDNSPAADTKIDYIIEVLNRIGYVVEHVSPAPSSSGRYLPKHVTYKGANTFRWFASFGVSSVLSRIINRWFIEIQFFLWCLFNLKNDEQIIVYHSLGYDSIFVMLKRIKKIRIIGDIEEIYQDVSKQKPSQERNEYRFIEACDRFMFPNTILNERLNKGNKPHLVCHGIYKVSYYEPVSFNDERIHVLYAGTYDPNKGGVLASIRAAQYLDDKYHLHVTGFGSEVLEAGVKAEINRVQSLTKCLITFHGFLDDKEFCDLMHHCSIGLCTQNPDSLLNLTSFPSKILNYIANGLVVISGKNRAITESKVADIIYYYDEQSPECIATCINEIKNARSKEGYKRLITLDSEFMISMRHLLK